MTPLFSLILLPYAINIITKLSVVFLDRKVMKSALELLASLPRSSTAGFDLTSDQQEVIVEHIHHALLKSTAVMTTFTSAFAAILTVRDIGSVPWVSGLLWAFLLTGAASIFWIYPKGVGYFSSKGWLGLEKRTLAVGLFCSYDLLLRLAAVTAGSLHARQVP
jgi:hypothetical protein